MTRASANGVNPPDVCKLWKNNDTVLQTGVKQQAESKFFFESKIFSHGLAFRATSKKIRA